MADMMPFSLQLGEDHDLVISKVSNPRDGIEELLLVIVLIKLVEVAMECLALHGQLTPVGRERDAVLLPARIVYHSFDEGHAVVFSRADGTEQVRTMPVDHLPHPRVV